MIGCYMDKMVKIIESLAYGFLDNIVTLTNFSQQEPGIQIFSECLYSRAFAKRDFS